MQVSSLLDDKLRDELVEDIAEEYEEIREEYYESLKVTRLDKKLRCHWGELLLIVIPCIYV